MPRLPDRTVLRRLTQLDDHLTGLQSTRLRQLAELIDEDDRIPLPRALAVATPGGDDAKAQDSFRKFRSDLTRLARQAKVDLRLVTDSRKAPPAGRFCWFEGADGTSEELADLSRRQADRVIGQPVPASVTEVLTPVVHIEIAGQASEALRRREQVFVDLMIDQVEAVPGYRITSALDLPLGADVATERRRLRASADVVIDLDSARARRKQPPGRTTRRPLTVALEGVPSGARPASGTVQFEERPFSQCAGRDAQLRFVRDVLRLVQDRLLERPEALPSSPAAASPAQRPEPDGGAADTAARSHPDAMARRTLGEAIARRLASGTAWDYEPVETKIGETAFGAGGSDAAVPRPLGTPTPAVERLLSWATDDAADARQLCALLGDVGMGKTTTIQMFTRELLARRERDASLPLPILFDLRDLTAEWARSALGLKEIVAALLRAGDHGGPDSAERLLDLVAEGNCILIFDGLDEVLVHLDPHAGQVFTRMLWRATEDVRRTRDSERQAARPSRLLLSCRTHYFRSIRDEAGHLTGQHRDGPRGADYLALLMLPFDEEQVRAYLTANVPGRDADRLLALIASVHDLGELSQRPLTLRMVADQLDTVERAKAAGRTVRAVDLYASFVGQWLERDEGKHSLLPEHKELLMEDLAARLWRAGRASWSADEIERWMLAFLAERPDLELHYPARAPARWKDDLRTATFLVRRDDDTFGFAHTSLREFWLARYLARALELPESSARNAWQLGVPSRETLDFLGQLLAGLDGGRRSRCVATLRSLATDPPGGQADAGAVLAFAYGLAATRADHPHHALRGSVLAGADLAGWRIEGGGRVDLRGAVLAGTRLVGARLLAADLTGADLTDTDLTRAEFMDSDLRDARLRRASLPGTIFRRCDLRGAHFDDSHAYRTQSLHCRDDAAPRPGWLLAPASRTLTTHARLSTFAGHTETVTGGAWSPDGTHILTTSNDGTARIWNATTGEHHLTLTGHTNPVTGGAWSPDGTHILTTSNDGTARIWNATTGEHHLTLTGHTNWVTGGAWSPDGTHILTTSNDHTARIWNATTGEHHLTLTGHTNRVTGGAWSPDSTHILTTSDDRTARIWNATTGEHHLTLTGHTNWVTG
ncbi:pentapeptide repeat-containing protein, partial [Frankia sp. AgKG'84/4]|uniref:NACHT and WD40 repeat domain-containing protein n=1 Tax=Frankia sp. AgKG'84/4 TaxID=573490 RepID=UPI002029FF59